MMTTESRVAVGYIKKGQPRRRRVGREHTGREEGLYKGSGGKKNIQPTAGEGRVWGGPWER